MLRLGSLLAAKYKVRLTEKLKGFHLELKIVLAQQRVAIGAAEALVVINAPLIVAMRARLTPLCCINGLGAAHAVFRARSHPSRH